MTTQRSLVTRFIHVIKPSLNQALLAILVAAGITLVTHWSDIMARFGITQDGLDASAQTVGGQLGFILDSAIAANLVLILFWGTIGLVAYLLCWMAYNLLIEARNEMTVRTAYSNRGQIEGPWKAMGIKAVSGMVLIVLLSTLGGSVAGLSATGASVLTMPGLGSFFASVLAVLALAAHLYLVLVALQLTFSPWYRPESFTAR